MPPPPRHAPTPTRPPPSPHPPSRKIADLEVAERRLQSRSSDYEITFRENVEENAASVAALRAKRAALGRAESKLKALAGTLSVLSEKAKEEEALRALVPAGSER